MRLLKVLDEKNYNDDMKIVEKYTVRAIIERSGKYIMQKSNIGEFKIPGGGVEEGETHIETLVREVAEEVGLVVDVNEVEEIGEILEIRKDVLDETQKYICHSYYYKCGVTDEKVKLNMTSSEIEKGFRPEWERLSTIVKENERIINANWQIKDTVFLRMMLNGEI